METTPIPPPPAQPGRSRRRSTRKRGITTRLVPLAAAASLALIGTAGVGAASAAPTPQLAPWIYGTVTPKVNGLFIRSGPSRHDTAYGLLYRGDHAKAITGGLGVQTYAQRHGIWLHIKLTRRSASGLRSGFTGWVYAAYLRPA